MSLCVCNIADKHIQRRTSRFRCFHKKRPSRIGRISSCPPPPRCQCCSIHQRAGRFAKVGVFNESVCTPRYCHTSSTLICGGRGAERRMSSRWAFLMKTPVLRPNATVPPIRLHLLYRLHSLFRVSQTLCCRRHACCRQMYCACQYLLHVLRYRHAAKRTYVGNALHLRRASLRWTTPLNKHLWQPRILIFPRGLRYRCFRIHVVLLIPWWHAPGLISSVSAPEGVLESSRGKREGSRLRIKNKT